MAISSITIMITLGTKSPSSLSLLKSPFRGENRDHLIVTSPHRAASPSFRVHYISPFTRSTTCDLIWTLPRRPRTATPRFDSRSPASLLLPLPPPPSRHAPRFDPYRSRASFQSGLIPDEPTGTRAGSKTCCHEAPGVARALASARYLGMHGRGKE